MLRCPTVFGTKYLIEYQFYTYDISISLARYSTNSESSLRFLKEIYTRNISFFLTRLTRIKSHPRKPLSFESSSEADPTGQKSS